MLADFTWLKGTSTFLRKTSWGTPRRDSPSTRRSTYFSATTDLYQVVSNVYQMRFVPVDRNTLLLLAVIMLLPFAPLVLMAFPASVILDSLKSLLM